MSVKSKTSACLQKKKKKMMIFNKHREQILVGFHSQYPAFLSDCQFMKNKC